MEQIVIKKEPEELGDISMNYNKPRVISADQEMPSTSGVAIKQEIKEELDDSDNSMECNGLGVKEETSTDKDDFDGVKQAKLKFDAKKEMFLDKGSEESENNYSDYGDEIEPLFCNVKEEGRGSDFSEEDDKNSSHSEGNEEKDDEMTGKEKSFKCAICQNNYKTKMGLFNHKKYFHEKHKLEQLKCGKCGYQTLRKSDFNQHLKIHSKKNYLKCHFCQYSAAQLQALNAHILSKHKIENNEENKLKITSKIHECAKCPYSTVIKTNYDNHIKVCLKLKNVKFYECQICQYRTIYKGYLSTHKKIHNKDKDLKCIFCHYESSRKINLDNHILSKHSDMFNQSNQNLITCKVHACKHCNYKTTFASDLKKHLNHNH